MAQRIAVLGVIAAMLAGCGGPLLVTAPGSSSPPPSASVLTERPAVVPVGAVHRGETAAIVREVLSGPRVVLERERGELVIPVGVDCGRRLRRGALVRVAAAAQEVAVVPVDGVARAPASPLPHSVIDTAPSASSTAIAPIRMVAFDGRLGIGAGERQTTVWLPPAAWRLGHLAQVWTRIEAPDCARRGSPPIDTPTD